MNSRKTDHTQFQMLKFGDFACSRVKESEACCFVNECAFLIHRRGRIRRITAHSGMHSARCVVAQIAEFRAQGTFRGRFGGIFNNPVAIAFDKQGQYFGQ